jgi:hypothetical protein
MPQQLRSTARRIFIDANGAIDAYQAGIDSAISDARR